MINILKLDGFLATIARLGATAHSFHHRQVEPGGSVWCTSVTGFRATEEVEVVVAEVRCSHGDGSSQVVVNSAVCVA